MKCADKHPTTITSIPCVCRYIDGKLVSTQNSAGGNPAGGGWYSTGEDAGPGALCVPAPAHPQAAGHQHAACPCSHVPELQG